MEEDAKGESMEEKQGEGLFFAFVLLSFICSFLTST
jgi:hypothetical protein